MLRRPRPEGGPPSVEELRAVIQDITAGVPHVFQSVAGGPLDLTGRNRRTGYHP